VICYDLLNKQKNDPDLEFDVENLFLLGSPLGMFLSVYYQEDFVVNQLPKCKKIYNVFHPSDLIAYRIEPLL
jgi:hypothetical protein